MGGYWCWHAPPSLDPNNSNVGRMQQLQSAYPLVMADIAIENGHRNSGFSDKK
jgi:hypothetical protein